VHDRKDKQAAEIQRQGI